MQLEGQDRPGTSVDVPPGRGGMFSLEGPEGVRFLIRSRIFSDEEIRALRAAGRI
jgi:uncharacterized protein (DUF779 family)